jgi:hypothetical protein
MTLIIEMEGIKMVSGQQPGPQGPYPAYQPMYQPVHRAPIEYVRPLVSDLVLSLGIALSLLLMWIGALFFGFSGDPDVRDIGMAIKSFGMLILTLALLLGGLLRSDMEKWVRVAMIAAATLLLSWVGFWAGFW